MAKQEPKKILSLSPSPALVERGRPPPRPARAASATPNNPSTTPNHPLLSLSLEEEEKKTCLMAERKIWKVEDFKSGAEWLERSSDRLSSYWNNNRFIENRETHFHGNNIGSNDHWTRSGNHRNLHTAGKNKKTKGNRPVCAVTCFVSRPSPRCRQPKKTGSDW